MSSLNEFANNSYRAEKHKEKIINNLTRALDMSIACVEETKFDTDYATDFMGNGFVRIGSRVLSNDTPTLYNSGVTKMMFRNSSVINKSELQKVVFDRHLDMYHYSRTVNGKLDTWFLANMRLFADIVQRTPELKKAVENHSTIHFVCKQEFYPTGDRKPQFSFNVANFPSIIVAGCDKFYNVLRNTPVRRTYG